MEKPHIHLSPGVEQVSDYKHGPGREQPGKNVQLKKKYILAYI